MDSLEPEKPASLLTDDDIQVLKTMATEEDADMGRILEWLGSFIHHGVSEGRFTERDAHHDLELALWVAYASNNIGCYENFYTSCDWLAGVEDLAYGRGDWYYRYANALMYCGKPSLALEYCERGVKEDPDYPWTWLTLGRLRAHFKDTRGAIEAGKTGLDLLPDNEEFLSLLVDIEEGRTLEEMEMHLIDPEEDRLLREMGERHHMYAHKMTAIEGIVCDKEKLEIVKTAMGVRGWSADHPYCTFLTEAESGSVMVTLMMNEAAVSKREPISMMDVLDCLDDLDYDARQYLEDNGVNGDLTLYGLSINRDYSVKLSYSGKGPEDIHTVDFDSDFQIIETSGGGPFMSMILLESPEWDPKAIMRSLSSDWGITLDCPEISEDTVVAVTDGCMVAISLVNSPIPGSEAVDAAHGNYLWPEGRDVVSGHKAHILVAVVNNEGDPLEAGMLNSKIVDSCLKNCSALGVYANGVVYQPEYYLVETNGLREKGMTPVYVMVWVGMYRSEKGVCAYTVGMNAYLYDELEVIDVVDEPFNVMNFMYDVIRYQFDSGVALKDGDHFAFSEDDEDLVVDRSPGLSIEGFTLKLGYPKKY